MEVCLCILNSVLLPIARDGLLHHLQGQLHHCESGQKGGKDTTFLAIKADTYTVPVNSRCSFLKNSR
jgi:hypothetical protein